MIRAENITQSPPESYIKCHNETEIYPAAKLEGA